MVRSTTRLVLYVRSLWSRQTHGQQRALLDRLETMTDDEVVAGYDVVVCGRQLPPADEQACTAVGRRLSERVRWFGEWARRNGLSVSRTFPERDVDSAITGESMRAQELPTMALAEYRDDALAFVAPTDEGPTVETRLDALASGAETEFETVDCVGPETVPLRA